MGKSACPLGIDLDAGVFMAFTLLLPRKGVKQFRVCRTVSRRSADTRSPHGRRLGVFCPACPNKFPHVGSLGSLKSREGLSWPFTFSLFQLYTSRRSLRYRPIPRRGPRRVDPAFHISPFSVFVVKDQILQRSLYHRCQP